MTRRANPVAGLVPATYVFGKNLLSGEKAWMAGTSPATEIYDYRSSSKTGVFEREQQIST